MNVMNWILRFVQRVTPKSEAQRELDSIREQMHFWHAEEKRTMQEAFDAYFAGDSEQYEKSRQENRTAQLRCKAEVRDKLARMR